MADKPKSGGPSAPSFYSAAASMKPSGMDGGKSNSPNTDPGAVGEKVKNIKVLLEVFDKLEKSEDDQSAKDMIRQMADLAKQYQSKLEGGAGSGKPPAAAASDSGPGAGAPGGGGAGAGAPGSESMAVPA